MSIERSVNVLSPSGFRVVGGCWFTHFLILKQYDVRKIFNYQIETRCLGEMQLKKQTIIIDNIIADNVDACHVTLLR